MTDQVAKTEAPEQPSVQSQSESEQRSRDRTDLHWSDREALLVILHEVGAPLSVLKLGLVALKKDAIPESQRLELLDRLLRSVGRVSDVVQAFMRMMRAGAAGITLTQQDVDLLQLAREVVAELDAEVIRTGCTVSVDGAPVVGRWDQLHVWEVIRNLVSNALTYGSGARVMIHVWRDGERAYFAVEDHGPGIDEPDQNRLFDLGFRAEPDSSEGHGIGLWIVRELAHALGGEVSVKSERGRGSCFTVSLPRFDDRRATRAIPDDEIASPGRR